jgi:hypothetical protein
MYEAREKSDASGFFVFEGLTEGTFTVTCGLYSEVVTLKTYESQVDVDLGPPPTQSPLAGRLCESPLPPCKDSAT